METLHPDRTAVEAQIRAAFEGVKLGKGTSLQQTQIMDRYGDDVTDDEFEVVPRAEITDSWSEVLDSWSDTQLREAECDCLAHLDEEGLRYYLPALMLSLLANYDPSSMRVIGTISALYPRNLGGRTRSYELLTLDQHRAVASFLSALPRLVNLDTEDAKCVERALRNYWGQFTDPLPQS
jgi:hypothetical protein